MKVEKRYIALALLTGFSVYNGIKDYNDDKSIKNAFDSQPAQHMQVTPGVDSYDDMIAARIVILEDTSRRNQEFTNDTVALCQYQNANMATLTCQDFYEARIASEAMKSEGVSLPQVILGETFSFLIAIH